ncbi:MAG: YybS family protein [Treponema sp.]|nr:YybS family protein [Treponema sp.]
MNKAAALPLSRETVSALVCAGICVVMMRLGLFHFFFLLPLGFCHAAFGAAAAWLGFVFAALGNAVLAVGISLRSGAGLAGAVWDSLYFGILVLGFTWVMAGNPPTMPAAPRVRTAFRFIAASAAGAAVFLVMIYSLGGEEGLYSVLRSPIEAVTSMYIDSSGADAAQRSYMEYNLTPDRLIDTFLTIALRGGSLITAFFLFFFSRQGSYIIARLFRLRGAKKDGDLEGFYAPRKVLWVLIICLPAVVIFKAISLDVLEIIAWNVLVICAVVYLAQGGGIALFTFTRRPMPGIMRLLIGLLSAIVVFSPGLNLLAVGALILLGIAENWLPLRKRDQGSGIGD